MVQFIMGLRRVGGKHGMILDLFSFLFVCLDIFGLYFFYLLRIFILSFVEDIY